METDALDEGAAGQELVRYCKLLHDRNLLAAADGNLSYRLTDGRILMTPSGRNKAFITPTDLAVIDGDGNTLSGNPSTERWMHLEIYRLRPEARCIFHAHPPTAIAWTVARPSLTELPCEALPEVVLAMGRAPIASYAIPGTRQMGEVLRPLLEGERPSKVIILARHGAVSWGAGVEEAYNGLERLEHAAQILKAAEELGGLVPLPAEIVSSLRKLREANGNRSL